MRLAFKTGTYAVTHFIVAIAVAFAITRDWRLSLAIGLIEPAAQTIAYFVHERLWERWAPGTGTVPRHMHP